MFRETTYYRENREEILRKARAKVTCECGAVVSYSSMGWHRHSQRHLIWKQMEASRTGGLGGTLQVSGDGTPE